MAHNNRECEGCVLLGNCSRGSSNKIKDDKETKYCPCINCLVKMLCYNPCPDFNIYTSYSYVAIKERGEDKEKKKWTYVKDV